MASTTKINQTGEHEAAAPGRDPVRLVVTETTATSADSIAWSDHARKNPRDAIATDACRLTHAKCNNCLPYALQWRAELLERLTRTR